MTEPISGHEKLDVYRLSIEYVAAPYGIAKDKNRFVEIARGSALECAAIHDMLMAFAAVDEEPNRQGKSDLRRIVSMLTRLIQRTDCVAQDPIEYEYEYRDAEYE
jgi:hypothetical protein